MTEQSRESQDFNNYSAQLQIFVDKEGGIGYNCDWDETADGFRDLSASRSNEQMRAHCWLCPFLGRTFVDKAIAMVIVVIQTIVCKEIFKLTSLISKYLIFVKNFICFMIKKSDKI